MKQLMLFFIGILVVIGFFTACSDNSQPETSETVPVVETHEITYIETRSALSGGIITDDRGETILSHGICWSTSPNPTTLDNYTTGEEEFGNFRCTLSDLIPNTAYYVRAYATNNNGTGYGQQRVFTTLNEEVENPDTDGFIYLWPKGNMPSTTVYTSNPNSQYFDDPDFRPYMVYFPVKEGVKVKGAILICAGGAFQFRSDSNEGTPVARALSELGYQSFVVNYRLRPYTQQEGALDLARAVRYVRSYAENYGIQEKNIAVAGFSAGGILCGEMLLNWKGTVNGNALDSRYVPDGLDRISADASAIGHIYSFYGRLSVASTDVELFRSSNLPPAFFCYGTDDPFVNQFAACVNALRQANVEVETLVLQGWPHGYGSRGDWIPIFDRWLMNIFVD